MMQLLELHVRHNDRDIYVLGSGPSLGYIDKQFFSDKVVICVNHTIDYVDKASNLYLVAKEPTPKMQRQIKEKEGTLVTCSQRFGASNEENYISDPDSTVLFRPQEGAAKDIDQREALEISPSTIVTAIHLAAFMGAKAVLLIGHDCGLVDGQIHIEGYDKSKAVTPESYYLKWMKLLCIEQRTLILKDILKAKYGTEVYSINPFINFGLEGHTYQR